jgi:hypothetical protein
MTLQMPMTSPVPSRWGRSVGAVLAGIAAGAVLSLATDQLLHAAGVFAPWGQVTRRPGPYAAAIVYRCAYAILGFWLTARIAPRRPMRHVGAAAAVAMVASIGGVLAALDSDMGPIWYPVGIALTTLPCAWLAGVLDRARTSSR